LLATPVPAEAALSSPTVINGFVVAGIALSVPGFK